VILALARWRPHRWSSTGPRAHRCGRRKLESAWAKPRRLRPSGGGPRARVTGREIRPIQGSKIVGRGKLASCNKGLWRVYFDRSVEAGSLIFHEAKVGLGDEAVTLIERECDQMRALSLWFSALCVAYANTAMGDPLLPAATACSSDATGQFEQLQRGSGQDAFALSAESSQAKATLVKADPTTITPSLPQRPPGPRGLAPYDELSAISDTHVVRGHHDRISISPSTAATKRLSDSSPSRVWHSSMSVKATGSPPNTGIRGTRAAHTTFLSWCKRTSSF
jgi:hypothetical protein